MYWFLFVHLLTNKFRIPEQSESYQIYRHLEHNVLPSSGLQIFDKVRKSIRKQR
jgi:hypothetical protein